jgi:hypothetical protein
MGLMDNFHHDEKGRRGYGAVVRTGKNRMIDFGVASGCMGR